MGIIYLTNKIHSNMERQCGLTGKGHKGTFWGRGNVLCFGVVVTCVYNILKIH